MTDSALQRARARALGLTQEPKAAPRPSQPTPSGRTVKLQDGTVVPESYYDLSSDDQRRMVELIKERESTKADESAALAMVNQMLDLRDKDQARWSKERSELLEVIAGLTARVTAVEEQDRTLELQKSQELLEQQASFGEAVVAAAAVETSLRNQTAASQVELDQQRDEHRDRLAATEKVLSDHEARLRSSGVLFGERAAAVETQVAAAESSIASAEVAQTDINNGIEQNRKTLQVISGVDLQNEIDLAVKRSFGEQLEPEMAALVERKYVLLAPTTGTDGYDDKPEGYDRAFLAAQMGDNPTERAVNRALSKSKRKRG